MIDTAFPALLISLLVAVSLEQLELIEGHVRHPTLPPGTAHLQQPGGPWWTKGSEDGRILIFNPGNCVVQTCSNKWKN